jgi:hypothetical protein
MSEPENFLARWSRRKQEAEREQAKPAPSESARASEGQDVAAPAPAAEQPEPEFDLSTLPSLDSIDAATDIRAFLQKGVPLDLTRAALRRAWTSDPAIRDFIEVAENQWDFATGSDIPGFGSLEASEDLRRMVASMFEAPPASSAEANVAKAEKPDVSGTDARGDARPPDANPAPDHPVQSDPEAKRDFGGEIIATQQSDGDTAAAAPPRKRHGSALPE